MKNAAIAIAIGHELGLNETIIQNNIHNAINRYENGKT